MLPNQSAFVKQSFHALTINGQSVSVNIIPIDTMNAPFGDSAMIIGHWDNLDGTITLLNMPSIDRRKITLLHEILHAAFPSWEEKDIEGTANRLYDTLDRNALLNQTQWNELVGA